MHPTAAIVFKIVKWSTSALAVASCHRRGIWREPLEQGLTTEIWIAMQIHGIRLPRGAIRSSAAFSVRLLLSLERIQALGTAASRHHEQRAGQQVPSGEAAASCASIHRRPRPRSSIQDRLQCQNFGVSGFCKLKPPQNNRHRVWMSGERPSDLRACDPCSDCAQHVCTELLFRSLQSWVPAVKNHV